MAETNEPLPQDEADDAGRAAGSADRVHPDPAREDERTVEGEHVHPEIRFEERDVPFRWILVLAIATVCVGAAIILMVYAFFRADTARVASRRESEFPLAEHPANELPAEPRLEQVDRQAGIGRENVYLRLASQEDQLELYGNTREKDFFHIPIRRAMESLAGNLPVRKGQPAPSKDNGLLDSGASNSGRLFRGAPQ